MGAPSRQLPRAGRPEPEPAPEVLLEGVFASAAVGLCLVDPGGRVSRVNDAWAAIVGSAAGDLVGRDAGEALAEALPGIPALLERARAGEVVDLPERRRFADGRERWYGGRISPLPFPAGPGALAAAWDVTAARRAEQAIRDQHAQLRRHVASTPLALVEWDGDFRVTVYSARAEQIFGFAPEEVLGKRIDEIPWVPAQDWPAVRAVMRDMWTAERPTNVSANRNVRKDGAVIDCEWYNSALHDASGRLVSMLSLVLDVTSRNRAEAALRESEARARAEVAERARAEARAEWLARFPEENPDPVLRLSHDLVVSYANAAALAGLRDLGVTLGRPAPPHLAELARRAREEGLRVKGEIVSGGATFSTSVIQVGGDVNVYATDVTARRTAERAVRVSEERFRRLVEVSAQVVWVTNALGEAVEDSPSWRAFTGRGYEQWAGWAWLEAVHPEDRGPLAEAWRTAVETRTPYRVEFRLLHASGDYRRMECRAVPILDETGAVREWVGMNVDITDRKLAEDGLRVANEQLREIDRRKDEFLAMLSHELRNPLAPIRNAVAVLDHASPSGEQAARARTVIGRQVQHLARLVDDLLDVTRIARGKIALQREPLDLVAVVNRAAEDHRALMYERGVSLAIELPSAPTWVDGDATRLAQVLGNLLQNAAKFTGQGGRVTVSVIAGGDAVEVQVRDTGVGIEPGLLGRMFEPFVQSDQTLARSQGGLGLGLALVKGIVELHGGSVRAESAGTGKGAEFVVRLPAIPPRSSGPEARTRTAPTARRRVLVVDDNQDAAESLADILTLLGSEVDVAYDGPAAIEKARARSPEVVLCDIGLPGMTGYDVARQLRALCPAARLVAVSGYARPEDVDRAREAGFDGHVAKPPDPAVLAELIGA